MLPMKMEAAEGNEEPKLQVKLVNYLGNQTSISLRVSGDYMIDGTTTKLLSTKTYTVKVEQSKINLYDGDTNLISGDNVPITPDNEELSAFINGREYTGGFQFIVEAGYVRPINNIYLEDYLKSVVPVEMYASWNREALKVQAVAARTYAYFRLGKIINDTTAYQVYGGKSTLHSNSTAAVEETEGEIVTYNGRAIDALFSASNGGMSESNFNEFGSPALPYFPIQNDDFDKKYTWNFSIQKQQVELNGLDLKSPDLWWSSTNEKDVNFTSKLKTWLSQNGYSNKQIKIVSISDLSFHDKTESGRVVRGDLAFTFLVKDKLTSTGELELQQGSLTNVIASKIRSFIGTSTMASTLVTETNETDAGFSFSGLGFGHGVGMSQHGANNRANAGHTYKDILAFYYPNTSLVKQYEEHQDKPAFTPLKVQLNGKDFSNGYFGNNTTYVDWQALRVFNIQHTVHDNGQFNIEGRIVQAELINGNWYIQWAQLSDHITVKKISGGYNFIYNTPINIELNGKAFKQGYSRNNTTYVNWSALKTLNIPYISKGSGVFEIEGRTVHAEAINGNWYIHWSQLSPGKIIYKKLENGGFNFIYSTPINIQINGKDFANGGYSQNNTAYINWTVLKTLKIPFSDKGNGVFEVEGRTVQAIAINGDWYIHWSKVAPKQITYNKISGGFNFIYTKPISIQLNGVEFAPSGYSQNNTAYVHWNALTTLGIPFTDKGNGVFEIEGRNVQALSIHGDWYIHWSQLSPGNVTYKTISNGFNFIYKR
jgi:SpoIID/LytB domain protein